MKRSTLRPSKRRIRARKPGTIAGLERECDILWSAIIKKRAHEKSEQSGEGGTDYDPIESAHVFPRRRKSTRWVVTNGVCLLKSEHSYFTDHSAEFMNWVRSRWPHECTTLGELELKSNTPIQVTEIYLLGVLEELRAEMFRLIATY